MKFTNRGALQYMNTFSEADDIQLLKSGDDFFNEFISLIHSSQESIQIQTFIFDDDETGNEISDALIKAIQRKVEIDLVVDSHGSRNLDEAFIRKLTDAGVQIRFFSPISFFKNLTIGRRLHHKVAVFDGEVAIVGGINLANRYRGTDEITPWLDFAVLIKGKVCNKLRDLCFHIEEKSFSLLKLKSPSLIKSNNQFRISIRQNDWLRKKMQIFQSYNLAIQNAENSITIFASYFLPGLRLRTALENAATRGIQIKIVLAGKSDIPLILNATYYLYNWLHKNKIRIFEWRKSVFHAKLAVVDQKWMTIGSFNLNHLSTYASIELNVDILSDPFVKKTAVYLDRIIDDECIEIFSNRERNLITKARELLAYFLGRTLLKTITFFPNLKRIYSND